MKIVDLFEKRRNADHPSQERKSTVDELKKYFNRDDIYISFTELPKIGINTRSSHGTPTGVYAYPLWLYQDKIESDGIFSSIPYAEEQPYINVLQATKEPLNVVNYTEKELYRDLDKIEKMYGFSKDDYTMPLQLMSDGSKVPAFKTLNRTLFKLIRNGFFKDMNDKYMNDAVFNGILRKLGYDLILDPGTGSIHRAEPIQAVFLSPKSYKVIDRIKNSVKHDDLTKTPVLATSIETSPNNMMMAFKKNPSIFEDLMKGINKNRIPLRLIKQAVEDEFRNYKYIIGTKYEKYFKDEDGYKTFKNTYEYD